MTAHALFDDLTRRGVRLEVRGERLAWRAPAGQLSEADKAAIRKRKSELLRLLAAGPSEACPTCGAALVVEREGGKPHRYCPARVGCFDSWPAGLPDSSAKAAVAKAIGQGRCPDCGEPLTCQDAQADNWQCRACGVLVVEGVLQ
jgi:hypothetical protein